MLYIFLSLNQILKTVNKWKTNFTGNHGPYTFDIFSPLFTTIQPSASKIHSTVDEYKSLLQQRKMFGKKIHSDYFFRLPTAKI